MEVECADIAFYLSFPAWRGKSSRNCYDSSLTRADPGPAGPEQRNHLPFLEAGQSLPIEHSLMSPPHLAFSSPFSFPSLSCSLLLLLIVYCPSSVSTATLGYLSISHFHLFINFLIVVGSGPSPSPILWYHHHTWLSPHCPRIPDASLASSDNNQIEVKRKQGSLLEFITSLELLQTIFPPPSSTSPSLPSRSPLLRFFLHLPSRPMFTLTRGPPKGLELGTWLGPPERVPVEARQ